MSSPTLVSALHEAARFNMFKTEDLGYATPDFRPTQTFTIRRLSSTIIVLLIRRS